MTAASGGASTHDFTQCAWGHNVNIQTIHDGGQRLSLVGWATPVPVDDDYVILRNAGGSTRYRLTGVRPCGTPADMWFADAIFAPRQEE